MIGMHFTSPQDNDPVGEVTHVRLWDCGVTWKDIHTAPDSYNWARMDMLMDKYEGKHITYVIAATPQWAASDPNAPHAAPWLGAGSNSLPGDLNASWKPFVANLSQRYAGRIKAYEIWNEPQLADFMYPWDQKNRNLLAQMTKDAIRIIKGNDPAALCGSASVLPRDSSGGMKKGGKYLQALADKDSKNWCGIDFVATHIYPECGKGAKRWNNLFWEVRDTMAEMGCPTKKVWVTETLYGLLCDPVASDEKCRQLVKDTYEYAGGKFVFWYAFNRPDLNAGMVINHGTATWEAIKEHG